MSSLITKATKRRSTAPQKIRATKGKKAASRKPARPGRITAAPKAKKAAAPRRPSPAKKMKPRSAVKKATAHPSKKQLSKKKPVKAPAKQAKSHAKKTSPSKKPVVRNPSRASKQKIASRKVLMAKRRTPLPKAAPPPPPKKAPSPGPLAAVRAFEQALRLFNKHDFAAAKPAFQSLVSKFAEQLEILARVRTYLVICEQRLARTPSVPRNPDVLYDQGVVEFNKGNTTEAIELFQKALKADPRADHVHYSLAAAHARLEDAPKALDSLRRAIGLRPIHRSHARRDLDLTSLRGNEDFQQLTGFGFDLIEE
jgi:tetratricopeptide (TPR) repeat protein